MILLEIMLKEVSYRKSATCHNYSFSITNFCKLATGKFFVCLSVPYDREKEFLCNGAVLFEHRKYEFKSVWPDCYHAVFQVIV